MIEAKLNYDNFRGCIKLRLRGHAAAAPRGEDLVCAAVSALALTAGQCAVFLDRRGLLAREPMVRLHNGDALVAVTPTPEALAETLMCFWTIQSGLYALQKQYPQYIKLTSVLRI